MVEHTIDVLQSTNNKITKVNENDTILISAIVAGSDKKIINDRFHADLIVITSEGQLLNPNETGFHFSVCKDSSPTTIQDMGFNYNFNNRTVKDLFDNNDSKLKKIYIVRKIIHDNNQDKYIHTIEVTDETADEVEKKNNTIFIIIIVVLLLIIVVMGIILYKNNISSNQQLQTNNNN